MKARLTILCAIAFVLIAGCTTAKEDEEPQYDYYDISGDWVQYAFRSSDGQFVSLSGSENDIYSFDHKGNFTRYCFVDGVKQADYSGSYKYDPTAHIIYITEPRGWNLDIDVVFTGEQQAIFDIKGRTATQSRTIKVKRQ